MPSFLNKESSGSYIKSPISNEVKNDPEIPKIPF